MHWQYSATQLTCVGLQVRQDALQNLLLGVHLLKGRAGVAAGVCKRRVGQDSMMSKTDEEGFDQSCIESITYPINQSPMQSTIQQELINHFITLRSWGTDSE